MSDRRIASARTIVQRALVIAGVACLAWYAAASVQSAAYQQRQRRALDDRIAAVRRTDGAAVGAAATRAGALLGRLDIARLGVSAVVIEGDEAASLKLAVGHVPGTPLPWEDGNSALAAHRDTFFRPLERIRAGDEIRFVAPAAEIVYRVRSTTVVAPDDLSVLGPTGRNTLTLVTCYPFRYVGSAPRRFIVLADRVE